MRTLVMAAVVLACLFAVPQRASADVVYGGSATTAGGVLSYVARPGFRNVVDVRRDGADWVVAELGGLGVAPGIGCTASGTSSVRCPAAGIGNARVDLGDWDDTVTLRAGYSNQIFGGDGNDTITGSASTDLIDGGFGADVMNGGTGEDTVSYDGRTRSVHASLDGVANNDGETGEWDTIAADVENVWGGRGDDYLYGSDVRNVVYGLGGYDYLVGLGGSDLLYGGDGNDTLDGGTGADYVYGDNGVDTADYSGRTASVSVWLDGSRSSGEYGEADLVAVTTENATGGSGGDLLVGNEVRNVLRGGPGADGMLGNGGDDALLGEDGNDALYGGDGNDWLPGDPAGGPVGQDTIDGGDGIDSTAYEGRTSTVYVLLDDVRNDGQWGENDNLLAIETVYGGRGDDVLIGSGGNDTLYGGDGRDYVDGAGGADVVHGESGDDTIYGEAGNDVLYGDSGADSVNGELGDDSLYGGTGVDALDGGVGTDRCEVADGGARIGCEAWL